MADPMCPAPWRIMKAAHDAEFALWELINDSRCGQIDIWRDGKIWKSYDFKTLDEVRAIFMPLRDSACWRAALRALAEMEPTPAMRNAGTVDEEQMYNIVRGECACALEVTDECKAYILAAAANGEKS